MMFTLLPGVGVELPHRAGTLRFGMSEQQAQWLISTLADVREEWVCIRARAAGVAWAFFAEYGDLTISVRGGGLPDDPVLGLDEVHFAWRGNPLPTAPAEVPVVYQDIDLFGYPIAEVEEALTVLHPHGSPKEVLAEEFGLKLSRPAAAVRPSGRGGRRPRHPADREPAATQYLVSATLTHPERSRILVG
jgi:hypothetical protein